MLALAAVAVDAREGRLRERIRERLQEQHARGSGDAALPGPEGDIRMPGLYRYRLRHDGLDREYLVYVPAAYRPGRAMPLLFAFHGGGGHMQWQADDANYGLPSKAEEAGFIAVFPNGFSRFPGGRLATWNAGDCCGDARDRAVDDVGFVRRVHADVSRRLTVDAARVYATGMSNGAMMAYRLACEAPDLFRAIAAVAGTEVTRGCAPAREVAVLHLHARDDSHVLFDGGAGPDAFRDPAKVTAFTSVPETVHRWVARNGCPAAPRRIVDRPGVACDLHSPCRGGARVQLCVTDTGGHSWPGGGAVRGKLPSNALSANDAMWSFFEALPPRGG
ncbi:MAG: alpha/beta hydrolase family esterase [Pseudomonadota bacterium]